MSKIDIIISYDIVSKSDYIISDLQLVGCLAFCVRSRTVEYIMVSIVLFKSAMCIDLACFHQLLCAKYFLFPMFMKMVFD